jgi:radical SAM-linked protein
MRIRITFTKTGPLIYIGNLDLHTMWERAARRAGLPLSYSKGFHPQPKIQLAAPLPLGFSSRCEVLDMRLDEDVDYHALPERLNAVMPAGINVLAAEVEDESAPALPRQVVSSEYEVTLRAGTEPADLERRVQDVLAAHALPRQRRSRSYDLRPLIESLEVAVQQRDNSSRIRMRLKAREGATGRPDEVLEALGIRREHARIERTALGIVSERQTARVGSE